MKRNLIFNLLIIGFLSLSVVLLFLIIGDVMFLVTNQRIKISVTGMMTTGTVLSPFQKSLAVGIVMSHINLLRQKDLNVDDVLNNIVEGVVTYGKVINI
jgi:hypothetical protein